MLQLKTLLNHVHPVKGFVYTGTVLVPDIKARNGVRLDVTLRPRCGSHPPCSGCGRRGPTYDHLELRRFVFVPLWGIPVFLRYAPRRVRCPDCGVRVEWMPWCEPGGKSHLCIAMAVFLAMWAKLLSWTQVANAFDVKWDSVFAAVGYVVQYGLEHRDLSGIHAIGVDEVAYAKGHNYLTLVYQIDAGCRRLLHIAKGRSVRSLLSFFHMLKAARIDFRSSIKFVCSDMWRAYLKVVAKKLPEALHILDRYHIVANLSKALDKVRAQEARDLAKKDPTWKVLKGTRWLLLRRRKRLDGRQRFRLRQLLQWNLRTVRAYILVEWLQQLWEYKSPTYAGRFLDFWCSMAMRTRIEPLKKAARSLREHRELILNWFRAKKQYNAGIVEGLNLQVKLRFRKAFGFRTFNALEIALYHQLGQLPVPPLTHRFC